MSTLTRRAFIASLVVGAGGVPLEEFLDRPAAEWF